MNNDYIKIANQLKEAIENDSIDGDMGDIGNLIGIVIGKNISDNLGFSKEDFINGLNHGFSLIDGTH